MVESVKKGFWVINHWPTQHANLVILMGRRSAMATPAVASLSVNDAEAVAHVVSVVWATFLSQKWSRLALIWDLWHMKIPVQRLQNWWSSLFIFGFTVCMLCCLVSTLPSCLPSTLLFQEHLPTLPENILRYIFGTCAINITGQVERDSFAQLGLVAFWLLLLSLGPGPNLSSLIRFD